MSPENDVKTVKAKTVKDLLERNKELTKLNLQLGEHALAQECVIEALLERMGVLEESIRSQQREEYATLLLRETVSAQEHTLIEQE